MIQSNQNNSNQTPTSQQQMTGSAAQPTANYMFVGPYRLEKTLGKGQTGKQTQAPSPHQFEHSLIQISSTLILSFQYILLVVNYRLLK